MESRCCLCDDLIRDILLRLPTKSLLRFKTVSKSWRSSITDPCFLNKSPKLIINYGYAALFSLDPSSSGNLEEKLSFPPEIEQDIKTSNPILVGSCNGLLLLRSLCDTRMWMLNVSTREFHTIHIPKISSSQTQSTMFIKQRCYGFGYDSVNDDYKVIKVSSYDVNRNHSIPSTSVYSLRNNAWRTNRARKGLALPIAASGVFVGGKLHWIAKGKRCILAFDVCSDDFSFHEIAALPKVEDVYSRFGVLSELDGCLSVTELSSNESGSATVWVLKEFGWVRVLRICDWSPFEKKRKRNGIYRRMALLGKRGNEVLMTDFYSCVWYNKENGNVDTLFSRRDSVSIKMCLDTLVSIGAYGSYDL